MAASTQYCSTSERSDRFHREIKSNRDIEGMYHIKTQKARAAMVTDGTEQAEGGSLEGEGGEPRL